MFHLALLLVLKKQNNGTTNCRRHLISIHKINCDIDFKKDVKSKTTTEFESFGIDIIPPIDKQFNSSLAEAWIEGSHF